MGPVRSLFYFTIPAIDTFAEVKLFAGMVLKLLIISIYLFDIVRLGIKWKRCRFVVEGNEVLLLLPLYPLALALPGRLEDMAIRVAVQVAFWGICFFWRNILRKELSRVVFCVMAFMGAMMLFELLYLAFFGSSRMVPLLYIYIVGCCYYVTFLLWNRSGRFAKNILSLEKIQNALLGGISLFLASTGVVYLFVSLQPGNIASWSCVLLFSAVPLLGLRYYKPYCIHYDEQQELKKKAYLLGRTIKGNQMLEDDPGAINECVVEDARIIYSIITIFEQEKLYLNTDVKIGDIARRLGTNKTYLSRALNTRLSKNFCQFVNHYRVKEACYRFVNDPQRDMKHMSEKCGFSSQSNFSIVFKCNTGYTPGDWAKMIRNKLDNNEKVEIDDYLL